MVSLPASEQPCWKRQQGYCLIPLAVLDVRLLCSGYGYHAKLLPSSAADLACNTAGAVSRCSIACISARNSWCRVCSLAELLQALHCTACHGMMSVQLSLLSQGLVLLHFQLSVCSLSGALLSMGWQGMQFTIRIRRQPTWDSLYLT